MIEITEAEENDRELGQLCHHFLRAPEFLFLSSGRSSFSSTGGGG